MAHDPEALARAIEHEEAARLSRFGNHARTAVRHDARAVEPPRSSDFLPSIGTASRGITFFIGWTLIIAGFCAFILGGHHDRFASDNAVGASANAAEGVQFVVSVAMVIDIGSLLVICSLLFSIRAALQSHQLATR